MLPKPAHTDQVQRACHALYDTFLTTATAKRSPFTILLKGVKFSYADKTWDGNGTALVFHTNNTELDDEVLARRTGLMLRRELDAILNTDIIPRDKRELFFGFPVITEVVVKYKRPDGEFPTIAPISPVAEPEIVRTPEPTKAEVIISDDDYEENTPSSVGVFNGFLPIAANFARTPNQFFTEVIPNAKPTVSALVGAVIYHTCGFYDADRQTFGRVWWPTTGGRAAESAGMIRQSFVEALKLARESGYVVTEKLTAERAQFLKKEFKLDYTPTINISLRGINNAVDMP